MNIQQLRYVVAIANSGTFREAASKLFVSQPSLSVAIKDLEQELNFQILTSRMTDGGSLSQCLKTSRLPGTMTLRAV